MAETDRPTFVHHNGAISAPKLHSPDQFNPNSVMKSFPSPFANQPPSIDIVLSSSQSKPISVAQMEDLVKSYVMQQRQKELDKAKFGALRDERDMYKTQLLDTSKAKENLKHEIGVLKERTMIMNQTMNERENAMRELQEMSRYVQTIEEQKQLNQNQLMEIERRNQELKRQLAEKQARDEAFMRSAQTPQYQAVQPVPMVQQQAPVPIPIRAPQGVTRITSNPNLGVFRFTKITPPNYSQVSPVLSSSIPTMNPMIPLDTRPQPAGPTAVRPEQGGRAGPGMGDSNDIFNFVQQYNMQNSNQNPYNFAGNSGIQSGPGPQYGGPSNPAATMPRQQQPAMYDPYTNATTQPGPNAVFNPLMKQPNF